jgi:hypothetical protein
MSTNQQFFYRTYGIRNINELGSPRLFELKQFEFPLRSLLHYATYDSIENGPPGDYPLFNEIKKPIYFKTVNEIVAFNGSPRMQTVNLLELVRDYRNNNRRMKYLTAEISSVVDPLSLVVLDYCLLNKRYRYVRNMFTDYHRWKNIFTTVIDGFVQNATNPQMAHYLPLSVPDVIPSLGQLDKANLNMDQASLKIFKDENNYTLLELWKWLDPKTSKDSLFSTIPLNKLHLFNLVYIKRSKWCVLNLGVLSSFRSLTIDTLTPMNNPVILSKVKLEFKQIQKRLLKIMMTIEAGSVVIVDTQEEIKLDTSNEYDLQEEDALVLTSEDDDQADNDDAVVEQVKKTPPTDQELQARQEKAQQLLTIEDDDEEDVVAQKIRLQDLELDQELEQLNLINERREADLSAQNNLSIYDILNEKEPELDMLILNICDKLADNNLLTAGEYKRFMRLSDSYKRIVAKDGISTLEDYVKIDQEDLKIEDTVNIPDSDAILDKSMLKSSMEVFDKQYVAKDIIGKDTAAMVLSMQKAGLIITDYKVERSESILGADEQHTIRIVPVEGVPCTIRFKIPVVNEDGTFSANGVRYFLRKQMGD